MACMAAGLTAAQRLSLRERSLRLCVEFIDALITELRYSMEPLEELFENLCAAGSLEKLLFPALCLEYMKKGEAFPTAFSQAVESCAGKLALDAEDEELAASLGGVLGATDAENQIKLLEGKRALAVTRLAQARERALTMGKLWRTLGAAAGACALILIL